jgi:phosphopantothenoylcysteine decarboxylase/phosphopantothenate--cysteine ligase
LAIVFLFCAIMLAERKILLGITGSIAAYKSISLVRLLVKQGVEVKVVMTPAANNFVSPLVLATLSKNEVLTGLTEGSAWANHVMLGRWADLMIIAPASCNTLAKMANGLCDNLLQAVYLSATCPVWVAPAMDEDMWKHPSTKLNLEKIGSFGNRILNVGSGELASGLVGEGRMAEPEDILQEIQAYFTQGKLSGKKAVVTAGPTYEPLDPVRFIGNHSSGKMGVEIAHALQMAGADTTLVLGPSTIEIPAGIKVVKVKTAQQMFDATVAAFEGADVAVMAAAVADYRPKEAAPEKIKKGDTEGLTIELVKTPDILKHCGSIKKTGQLLVGFALETTNEEENAQKKLVGKKADMIVLNSLNDADAGFGTNTNKVTIFEKSGAVHRLPLQSKKEVATSIVNLITTRLNENKL